MRSSRPRARVICRLSANALYSAFYVLETLMILLYPFIPNTMERLRRSLALRADVFRLDQLGTPIAAGHELGSLQEFFRWPAHLRVRRRRSSKPERGCGG
jgi:methionyl-tRNA synthetase